MDKSLATIIDSLTSDRSHLPLSFVISGDEELDFEFPISSDSFSPLGWESVLSTSPYDFDDVAPIEIKCDNEVFGKKCIYNGKIYKINYNSYNGSDLIYGNIDDKGNIISFGPKSDLKILEEKKFLEGIRF